MDVLLRSAYVLLACTKRRQRGVRDLSVASPFVSEIISELSCQFMQIRILDYTSSHTNHLRSFRLLLNSLCYSEQRDDDTNNYLCCHLHTGVAKCYRRNTNMEDPEYLNPRKHKTAIISTNFLYEIATERPYNDEVHEQRTDYRPCYHEAQE